MEINDHGQIEPFLAGPDIGYITRQLLFRATRREVTIQQVRRDIELMIAIGRCLVFTRADNRNVILLHQSTDAPMADIQTKLFQLFGHARTAITAQCKTVLLTDMRQYHKIPALAFANRARPMGPVYPRRHLQYAAQSFDRPSVPPGLNESKPLHF